MTKAKVSDTTARTTRGGVQGGVAYALVALLASFVHLTAEQFGALVVVVGIAVAFIQNVAENRAGVALLRKVPPRPAKVPVVDQEG